MIKLFCQIQYCARTVGLHAHRKELGHVGSARTQPTAGTGHPGIAVTRQLPGQDALLTAGGAGLPGRRCTARFEPSRQPAWPHAVARQAVFDAGAPAGLPRRHRRASAPATGASPPLPAALLDRRVEITGPVDPKMVINALNSGANVYMADFEDSTVADLGQPAHRPARAAQGGAPARSTGWRRTAASTTC